MTAVARIKGDPEPVLCGVCRRRATGMGYAPNQKAKILWLCGDLRCASVAKKAYFMPPAQIDKVETIALDTAGEKAGAYLDELGKTDLATLTSDEWATFLGAIVGGFEDALREHYLNTKPPF